MVLGLLMVARGFWQKNVAQGSATFPLHMTEDLPHAPPVGRRALDYFLSPSMPLIFCACSRCDTSAGRTSTNKAFKSLFLTFGTSLLSATLITFSWRVISPSI